eukprot:11570-Hanusia_phi.AAC.1
MGDAEVQVQPDNWEALIQLQFVLHRAGQLKSARGDEVSDKICRRVKELLGLQQIAADASAMGLCNFFEEETWQRAFAPSLNDKMRQDR